MQLTLFCPVKKPMLKKLFRLIPQLALEYPAPASLVQPAVGSFHLQPQKRILPLQQGLNFSDIGGYPTDSGKTVRDGLVYRSGQLARLSEADLKLIRGLRPRLIVDLRSRQ